MIRFRNLTEKQKALICNGCGPKGGWVPVPEFCFHASCDHHDFNYWLGHTILDRLKADLQFYKEMRRDAGWHPGKLALALSYFLAVRAFGAVCFHYAEKERDEADLAAALLTMTPGGGSQHA
jgi:hypothetical protein